MATRYITKIGVLSLGKIVAAIYAVMGLILGVIISLTSLGMDSMMGNAGAVMGMPFGVVGAIIVVPIFYGIMGFLIGIISAFIFNVATRFMGGLEIEVE